MLRRFIAGAAFGVCLSGANLAFAQSAALIAAADPTELEDVTVAQVMADDSTVWLSVRVAGRTRLALVTSQGSSAEPASAEPWLRALDFATRMRVAAPAGATTSCTATGVPKLADSGSPERALLRAQQVWTSETELDLRRSLADVGLTIDVASATRFSASAAGPFRVAVYEVPAGGASTAALRLTDTGHALELPRIEVAGIDSLPLSFIGLANGAVLPPEDPVDPSEFPVSYRAADSSTDYASARRKWRAENPAAWLSEASATSGLYSLTVFPTDGQIAAVVSRYFQATSGLSASACEQQVQTAHTRGSQLSGDYECDGADDLARSSAALAFETPRLTRLYGSTSPSGVRFRVLRGGPRLPRLVATDFDGQGCPPRSVGAPITTGGEVSVPEPAPSEGSGDYYGEPQPVYRSDGSCNGAVFADSCSGDSSTDASSSDSCSGDTSSQDPSSDSCSGDTGDTSSDSCSGGSDTSSDDSGCGKSEYDGDTCSGSSSSGADHAERSSSAALHARNRRIGQRPRPVRLSLLTLLAAALALPLRRRAASR